MNKKIRRLLLKMLIKNEHDVVKKKEETYQLLRPRTNQRLRMMIEKNVLMGYDVPHS